MRDIWEAIQALDLTRPDWEADWRFNELAYVSALFAGHLGLADAPECAPCLYDPEDNLRARAWLRRVQGALRERGGVGR
jgi:N-acetylmuramic acid 6-phosphate (MurNAc-6-P) etherase